MSSWQKVAVLSTPILANEEKPFRSLFDTMTCSKEAAQNLALHLLQQVHDPADRILRGVRLQLSCEYLRPVRGQKSGELVVNCTSVRTERAVDKTR